MSGYLHLLPPFREPPTRNATPEGRWTFVDIDTTLTCQNDTQLTLHSDTKSTLHIDTQWTLHVDTLTLQIDVGRLAGSLEFTVMGEVVSGIAGILCGANRPLQGHPLAGGHENSKRLKFQTVS